MTKVEAVQIIMASPEDDLGDTLMQLAATYWLEQPNTSKDEVLYLFEETLGEAHGS